MQRLVGADQFGEVSRVGLEFRQAVSLVERDHTFKTSPRRNQIVAGVIDRRQESKDGCFSRLVAEFDVMFRGIVQAAFRLLLVATSQKRSAKLAVGGGQAFFIAHSTMCVERPNQNADNCVSTRPLSGMPEPRTWSKAEIRSVATISSASSQA